jgi:hypothetical protein
LTDVCLNWPVDERRRLPALHGSVMPVPRVFIGSEAVAAGLVTKYGLATEYQRVMPDVYAPKGELSLRDRTLAAWK